MSNSMKTNGTLVLAGPNISNQQAEFASREGVDGCEELTVKLRKNGADAVHTRMWFDLCDCDVTIKNDMGIGEGVYDFFGVHFHDPNGQDLGLMLSFDQVLSLRGLLNNYINAHEAVAQLGRDETIPVSE